MTSKGSIAKKSRISCVNSVVSMKRELFFAFTFTKRERKARKKEMTEKVNERKDITLGAGESGRNKEKRQIDGESDQEK